MRKPDFPISIVVTLIFVSFLCASLIGWQYARKSSFDYAAQRFKSESNHLHYQIEARFSAYEQVLRGGVGLFNSSERVTREEWRSYVKQLAIKDNFPGIQGIGYSEWIGNSDALETHLARIHADGFAHYTVKPANTRELYTSIIYLEPFDDRNQRAFGYDMFSEATRREAMERARDSGNPALSGKVELKQEITSDKQAGFLLYLPVYESGDNPDRIDERRNALSGFIYSPFRANDLMSGILERGYSTIVFRIYDQSPSLANSLLYDGAAEIGLDTGKNPATFSFEQSLEIAGRQWTIQFLSTPIFEKVHDSTSANAVLSIGILLSLLISTIAWMLLSARLRVKERTTEISKIEHANSQLKEATRIAQSANQAKSSFLAAMSHEIRTPMNGVVGMVEVLLNETPSTPQASSLRVILDSANTLLAIIDDILDFSKIEAGHLDLEKTEESLSDIVDSVVCSMIPQAIKSGVIVAQYIDPRVPEVAYVDALRLRQILTNLIGNAVKFTGNQAEHDGRVQVRVTPHHTDPAQIQFAVIDNGIGIKRNAIDTIFDSFVQAESSTTRRFGGSGLGLAICKRLANIMGGTISVTSEVGQGSSFSVVLPLEKVVTASILPYENLDGVTCIILDDDDYTAWDMKTYLESAGADVHIATEIETVLQNPGNIHEPVVLLCSENIKRTFVNSAIPRTLDIRYVLLSRTHGRHYSESRHADARETDERSDSTLISEITVQLDGLCRRNLIETVAIAAGKASPEILQTLRDEPLLSPTKALSMGSAMAAGTLILVAEDDLINQKVLDKQLSLLGFTAEFANNGAEALRLWRKNHYGMIFTDLHMPQMDGYQLTKTVRSEEADGEHIPIIALTANALRGEVKRALRIGIDQYLTKPIRLRSLKQTIEHHLSEPDNSEKRKPNLLNSKSTQGTIKASRLFDASVLPDLLGQDKDAINECLSNFLKLLDDQGELLTTAIYKNDKPVAMQLSHRLISTSMSVGALELGDRCQKLEEACNEPSYLLSESDAQFLSSALARTRQVLSKTLKAA